MAELTNVPKRSKLAINRIAMFSEKEKRLLQVAIDAAVSTVSDALGTEIDADIAAQRALTEAVLQSLEDHNNDWKIITSGGSANTTAGTARNFVLQSGSGILTLDTTNSAKAYQLLSGGMTIDYGLVFMACNAGAGTLTVKAPAGGELIVNGVGLGVGFDQDLSAGELMFMYPDDNDEWVCSLIQAGGGGGSGDVTKVGTPVDDQVAVWTGDGTVEGTSALVKTVAEFQVAVTAPGPGTVNHDFTTTDVTLGNYVFNTDQIIGAGQDNYVLTYDHGTGEIGLEASAGGGGGLSNVVEDTTPELGGALDTNDFDIEFRGATAQVGAKFFEGSAGANYARVIAPATLSADYTLTLPTDDGTAGQVLQTNGTGTLSWTSVAAGSSPSTGYGEISVDSNATTTTFSGSSVDWSNKVQVTVFDANGTSSSGVTPDHTNDHITISNSGPYYINCDVCFSGGSSDTISMALFKNNGATQLGDRTTRKLGTGGDVGACSVSALADLSASDTVELWVQNESGTSATTIQDAKMAVLGLTGLGAISEDSAPTLGNDLDTAGYDIDVENDLGSAAEIRFHEAVGSNYVAMKAPSSLSANWNFVLPTTNGSPNQVLQTDGSGNMSWAAQTTGVTAWTGLSDTPGSIAGEQWVKGNAGGTALEFTSAPVQSVSVSGSVLTKTGTTNPVVGINEVDATSQDGYMSWEDKAKLDGITADADPTTAATVAAAGAVMDSDFSGTGLMARDSFGYYQVDIAAGDGIVVTDGDAALGANPTIAADITLSTSAPSGTPSGGAGAVWYRYTA